MTARIRNAAICLDLVLSSLVSRAYPSSSTTRDKRVGMAFDNERRKKRDGNGKEKEAHKDSCRPSHITGNSTPTSESCARFEYIMTLLSIVTTTTATNI